MQPRTTPAALGAGGRKLSKRESKRERLRRLRSIEEFPGLEEVMTPSSEQLCVGTPPLEFANEDSDGNPNVYKTNAEVTNAIKQYIVDAPWQQGEHEPHPGHHLSAEAKGLVQLVCPTKEELERRQAVVARLQRVILGQWPTAQIEIFGSYASGIGLFDADVDVAVANSNELKRNIRSVMYKLAEHLRRRGAVDVKVIAHARVPIIRYVDSGVHVDVAFAQESCRPVVKLVGEWLKREPGLKPLCMLLRLFLKHRSLGDASLGGLGGFATLCMAYSRLMQLRSSGEGNPVLKEGVSVNNLGLLVLDFFDFYGQQFDSDKLAVRVRSDCQPFLRPAGTALAAPSNENPGIAIENPLDPTRNITKVAYNYPTVRRCFRNAASYLKGLIHIYGALSEDEQKHLSFFAPLVPGVGHGRSMVSQDEAFNIVAPELPPPLPLQPQTNRVDQRPPPKFQTSRQQQHKLKRKSKPRRQRP